MPTKEEILKFSNEIEKMSRDNNCDYMEAIVTYCEKTGFEVELAATLLSNPLKNKIQEQVEVLNLLKKKTARLPV